MLPLLPSPLLISFSLTPLSSPPCVPNVSPAFTSSLHPLPLHLLILQANSSPKDVTCHIMSAESLPTTPHTEQTRLSSFLTSQKTNKKKPTTIQHNFKWHITEKHG